MAEPIVVGINVFGVLVSVFSVFVTLRIYQKYRLPTSLFFILTGLAVFVWNVIHLLFNFIGEETFEFQTMRFIWLVLVYSGITFFYMFVFGYSALRYEHINWRIVIYSALATAFSVLFATEETWVTVGHDPGGFTEGWVTVVKYQAFWSLFSISLLVVGFIEIIIPLVNTYAKATYDRQPLFVMLIAVLLAIFSNALEPLLTELDLPQAIRFLVADFGFLLFFIILLRYPFTGLYDTSVINQVIVADENGVPKLSLSPSTETAILTSGAIIGVNAILEEITSKDIIAHKRSHEINRKIELGIHQFFIIIRGPIIVAFQFENPTGVCYAKFKSLARIFSEDEEFSLDRQIEMFQSRLKEYFNDFTTTSEQEERMTTFAHTG